MNRVASRAKTAVPRWHRAFLAMLPVIVAHARVSFRQLDPEARAEAIQEVVANALRAYARLVELGKVSIAYPSVLAKYGVAQVRDGRRVGGHLNVRDVLSPYCQRLKGVVVERLDRFDEEENAWQEAVVEDTRTSPVPDTVAFRVDFADWLRLLPRRLRKIATLLATGETSTAAAEKFAVSVGRISQIRRELKLAWEGFQGELLPVPAAA